MVYSLIKKEHDMSYDDDQDLISGLADEARTHRLRVEVLEADLTEARAKIKELEAWRSGKRGVEDYYALQRENDKLRAQIGQ